MTCALVFPFALCLLADALPAAATSAQPEPPGAATKTDNGNQVGIRRTAYAKLTWSH
jgi:hypothetical protein